MADRPEAAVGKKLNTLMLLLMLILLINIGVVVSVLMLKMGQTGVEEPDILVIKPEMGKTYSVGDFVTNLADVEPPRFIKTSVEIEYPLELPELDLEIRERLPQFKDMVVNMLGDRHSTELLDAQGKARLKEELMDMMNNVLKHGHQHAPPVSDWRLGDGRLGICHDPLDQLPHLALDGSRNAASDLRIPRACFGDELQVPLARQPKALRLPATEHHVHA